MRDPTWASYHNPSDTIAEPEWDILIAVLRQDKTNKARGQTARSLVLSIIRGSIPGTPVYSIVKLVLRKDRIVMAGECQLSMPGVACVAAN